jgi:RHS repeat-associated protein
MPAALTPGSKSSTAPFCPFCAFLWRYTWQYDERHARVKETKASAAGTRTTWSLHPDKSGGLAFEQEFAENGTVTNRNFLTAGGAVIGVLITQGDTWVNNAQVNRTTIVRTEYWHRDHLGSTAAVTDAAGAVTARYAYDPWGKRRFTNGSYDAFGTLVIEFSAGNADRGFTGHEHRDDVGIVHMNGRLYDAHTGRFLQPDPYVQEILLLQNFNRYSYVLNNPLNAPDPSGEFMIIPILLAGGAAYAIWKNFPELRPFMAIAVAVILTPGNPWAITFLDGAIAQAAVAGFASGVVATGNVKGGVQGAISAVIFYGTGRFADGLAGTENLKNGVGPWANEGIGRAAFHAAAGCLNASVSGGDCGRGATTSGLTKLLSANIPVGNGIEANTVKYAVIGGTISVIGGGKFANGAVTGAFQYLFNEVGATRGIAYNAPQDDPSRIKAVATLSLSGTAVAPTTAIESAVPVSGWLQFSISFSLTSDGEFFLTVDRVIGAGYGAFGSVGVDGGFGWLQGPVMKGRDDFTSVAGGYGFVGTNGGSVSWSDSGGSASTGIPDIGKGRLGVGAGVYGVAGAGQSSTVYVNRGLVRPFEWVKSLFSN